MYTRLRKTKAVIFPKDQKSFLNLMARCGELYKTFQTIPAGTLEELEQKIPTLPELRKIVEELNKNYFPFHLNGKVGIVPRGTSEGDIYRNFGESSRKNADWSMIPLGKADQYIRFKETPKIMSEQLADVTSKLDDKLQTLVNLSADMGELYKVGLASQAENMKKGIKERFLEFGAKFCNLYQRYLKKLMVSLADKPQEIINAEIKAFVTREANNIFFIFIRMSSEEINTVSERLQYALETHSKYVAIHSLGGATIFAKMIVDGVELAMEEKGTKPEGYSIHTIDTGRDFSKIWYTQEGNKILNYLSRI